MIELYFTFTRYLNLNINRQSLLKSQRTSTTRARTLDGCTLMPRVPPVKARSQHTWINQGICQNIQTTEWRVWLWLLAGTNWNALWVNFKQYIITNNLKGKKHWPMIILHGEVQTQQTSASFKHAVTLLKHQNGKLRVKNSLKGVEVFGNVKQAAEHEVNDQVPHPPIYPPYTPNDWSLAHNTCWYVEFRWLTQLHQIESMDNFLVQKTTHKRFAYFLALLSTSHSLCFYT